MDIGSSALGKIFLIICISLKYWESPVQQARHKGHTDSCSWWDPFCSGLLAYASAYNGHWCRSNEEHHNDWGYGQRGITVIVVQLHYLQSQQGLE